MMLLGYIARRLLRLIPTLFGISVIVFLLLFIIPGDPVDAILAHSQGVTLITPEQQALIRKEWGLDLPIHEQYIRWLTRVISGDLGESIFLRSKVLPLILGRLEKTIVLAIGAMTIGTAVAIPLGVVSALRRNTAVDYIARTFSLAGVSIPVFWLGMILIIVFSVQLRLLPPMGYESPLTLDGIKRLIMPSFAASVGIIAFTSRLLRSSLLEVLGEDYILVARAKGLHRRIIIYRHALKNALIPTVTYLGLAFGGLLGGLVTTEIVFNYPGLGSLTVTAIGQRDYPIIQAVVLYYALVYVLANLIVDIIYTVLDPRIRLY